MKRTCQSRVVVVTGAGRGIGRAHAVELARQGSQVVANDLGAEVDGSGASTGPVGEVVDVIRSEGGEAVANGDDISDWEGAKSLIDAALSTFGDVHAVVNNAGILRDRMLVNMTPQEWDAVIGVHLRGTFAVSRHAAAHWRTQAKDGREVDARIINTSSASGLYGNEGQTNYGAAKAGIAAFTVIAAKELARYGITVNAIAPAALTRMTATLQRWQQGPPTADEFDEQSPDNVAPLVAWLASEQSRHITGRVFNIRGGRISVAEGWIAGPEADKGARWDTEELGDLVPELVAKARPNAAMSGRVEATEN